MKLFTRLLITTLLLATNFASAQTVLEGLGIFSPTTVAALPAAAFDGIIQVVRDGTAADPCGTGGGTLRVACIFNGLAGAWQPAAGANVVSSSAGELAYFSAADAIVGAPGFTRTGSGQFFMRAAATDTTFIIQEAPDTQDEDIFQVKAKGGGVQLSSSKSSGHASKFRVNTSTIGSTQRMKISAGSSNLVALTLLGATSPNADLQQWQLSTTELVSMVTKEGRFSGPSISAAQSFKTGLAVSNSGGDTDHDVDVAAGVLQSFDETANITFAAQSGKQLDVKWATGAAAGMLGMPDTTSAMSAAAAA